MTNGPVLIKTLLKILTFAARRTIVRPPFKKKAVAPEPAEVPGKLAQGSRDGCSYNTLRRIRPCLS